MVVVVVLLLVLVFDQVLGQAKVEAKTQSE